jgi:hypothetical protein
MHDRWEYLILMGRPEKILTRIELRDKADVDYGPLSEQTLNRLGAEGWEVCGYNNSSVSPCTLILKRRVDPE